MLTLADELLGAAAERDLPQRDEQLYFTVLELPAAMPKRVGSTR